MSNVDLEARDTFRSPVLFPTGEDRRHGPRVALDQPVQVGPPGAVPKAPVSALDVSVGGLFINADREVRVGARFSVSIPLPGGGSVYVAEAEAAYNRGAPHVHGFGVRFVKLEESARADLERLVAQTEAALTHAKGPPTFPSEVLSDVPTVPAHPVAGVRFSPADDRVFHEVGDPGIGVEEPMVGRPPTVSEPDLDQCGIRRVSPSHGRADHVYWVAGVLGVVLVLLGLGVTLLTDRGNEAVASEKTWENGNVRSVTHQVLMGERDLAALDEPPPLPAVKPEARAPVAAADARRAPLPELVTVDRLLAVEGPPAPKALASKAPAPQASASKAPAPQASAPRRKVVRARTKAKAKRKEVRPAARAPWLRKPASGARSVTLDLPIDLGARVKRTAVFDKPVRFVIDVLDQTTTPKLPPGHGAIRRVRFGRHEHFTRYVLDMERPISVGRVTKYGNRLQVVLRHR